jgi:hypothetical protein
MGQKFPPFRLLSLLASFGASDAQSLHPAPSSNKFPNSPNSSLFLPLLSQPASAETWSISAEKWR